MKLRAEIKTRLAAWNTARSTRRESRAVSALIGVNPVRLNSASRSARRSVRRAVVTLNSRGKEWMVRNWYESGNPYSDGSRSYLPEVLTDARYDQNQITSREAMRRMRYWEQNSVFVKRALDISGQYVIGKHMPVVTPLGSDAAWTAKAETVFAEMTANAGLNGESLFEMLLIGCRRKKIDRDVFFVQTSKPGKVTIRAGTKHETQLDVFKPCYQMVESHRVGSPFAMWAQEGFDCFDGVEYREITTQLPTGQTVKHKVKSAYWVNDSSNVYSVDQGFTRVPVEYCYRAAQAHRVNESRSMTDFYAAEPTLALLEDLLKLEMRAQEVQSDISLFITNGAGAMVNEKTQATLGALGIKVGKDGDGKPIVTAKDIDAVKTVYEKIWGGRTAVGRTGDTLTPMAPNRPAEATLNLWNFLIDSFCVGAGYARILIFPTFAKGQGTEIRAQIEACSAQFIQEFNLVWKPFIQQVWECFIGWAVKNDERLKNPPSDWRHIEVSAPRSVCVDLGYDSDADLAQLAAGVTNLHAWAQKHGTTKAKLIRQSVSDLYDIKLACLQFAQQPEYAGITVEAAEVRQNLSEVIKNLAAMKTAQAAQQTAEANLEPTTA
jgi:hypothetical protein